jgi:hypothetical protein
MPAWVIAMHFGILVLPNESCRTAVSARRRKIIRQWRPRSVLESQYSRCAEVRMGHQLGCERSRGEKQGPAEQPKRFCKLVCDGISNRVNRLNCHGQWDRAHREARPERCEMLLLKHTASPQVTLCALHVGSHLAGAGGAFLCQRHTM